MGIFHNLSQFAHGATEGLAGTYQPAEDLEETVGYLSARFTIGSAIGLLVLIIIAAATKDRFPHLKLPLFISIATIMIGSTLWLAGSTVYVNVVSDSGGPVHWHADYEVWACGNELELRDPFEFLSNKIGTATLHEHDDRRIHLEGVVVDDSRDASLGKYFYVIDGAITADAIVVPLNPVGYSLFEDHIDGDGPSENQPSLVEPFLINNDKGNRYFRAVNGEKCGDETAYIQVFVFTYDEATMSYHQDKITNPVTYSISPYSTVPPGDCIIIEFDVLKDQTNKLCDQYGIRDIDRCEQFGVEPEERDICAIKQLDYPKIDPNAKKLENASQRNGNTQPNTQEAADESGPIVVPATNEGGGQ